MVWIVWARCRPARCLLLAGWLLASLAGASAAHAACTEVRPITELTRQAAPAEASGAHAAPPAPRSGLAVPDRLPLALRDERVRIAYTLDVSACAEQPGTALWLFRVGAPYRISADGRTLASMSAYDGPLPPPVGSADGARYNGRIPALFALPPGARQVRIELLAVPYIPYGIVAARMGPTNLLLPRHSVTLQAVVGQGAAASGVVLVIGLLTLLLWLPRRRDLNLLWLAFACGLWGVRGVIYFDPMVAGAPRLYEQLNPVNALLAVAALAVAAIHLVRPARARRQPIVGIAALVGAVLGSFVLVELLGHGAVLARAAAHIGGTLLTCWLGLDFWRQRRRLPWYQTAGLLTSLLILLGCALHDLLVVAGVLPPDADAYVFWGLSGVLVAFALISGEYVVQTLKRAERSNEELERHVARKSHELEQSYARLRDSEREAGRTQERERLMREMHDGLGAHLMTALRGVERGALGPAQVAQSLQDSLDELRLLIDGAEMGDYLPGALAIWRNRWDDRLAAAGVGLHWRLDESLDDVRLSGDATLQVLRILQEAATNIVKHAQARHMTLQAGTAARAGGRELRIAIRDDGRGMGQASDEAGQRGLRNMRHRAEQLGARLDIGPNGDGPGTEVLLRLPLDGAWAP